MSAAVLWAPVNLPHLEPFPPAVLQEVFLCLLLGSDVNDSCCSDAVALLMATLTVRDLEKCKARKRPYKPSLFS